MKIALIGAGLTSATLAVELNKKGHKVVVYEKTHDVGGHVADRQFGTTHASLYGPHVFHTSDETVWDFVNRYSDWQHIEHRVQAQTQCGWLPWPINHTTIKKIYEEEYGFDGEDALRAFDIGIAARNQKDLPPEVRESFETLAMKAVGPALYRNMIYWYTQRQWQRPPNQVPAEVFKRTRIVRSDNDLFFDDTYVAEPANGYTNWIRSMFAEAGSIVLFDCPVYKLLLEKLLNEHKVVISTAPPDVLLQYQFGKLDYLKVRFHTYTGQDVMAVSGDWPTPVVNFSQEDTIYTRGTDYQRLMGGDTPVVTLEEPHLTKGEALYPVRTVQALHLYKKYKEALDSMGVISAGRLGGFVYTDMAPAISAAMRLAEQF